MARMLSVLRVFAAGIYLQHGTQKMFGFPPSEMGRMPFVLGSLNGVAGVIEVVGGSMLLIGFLTRPVAFVLSGEMAVAYMLKHAPHDFWPIVNHGEVPVLLSFLFLYFAFAGGGAWAVDALFRHVTLESHLDLIARPGPRMGARQRRSGSRV